MAILFVKNANKNLNQKSLIKIIIESVYNVIMIIHIIVIHTIVVIIIKVIKEKRILIYAQIVLVKYFQKNLYKKNKKK